MAAFLAKIKLRFKAKKKKSKNVTRKIPVVKVEERKEGQVKSASDYKPAISKMYQDENGRPLNLTNLKKVAKTRRSLYLKIIIILLFLFGAATAGFFIFFGNNQYKEGDIVLTIEGPENLSSGDEAVYTIHYLNQGKSFLGQLELTLNYPDGFTFKEAIPEANNTYNQYWRLGDLGSGKSGQVEIKGQLMGEVGSVKNLEAKLSYKPSNFNSLFETRKSFATLINDSIIDLSIEGAKQAISDYETTYSIKYKNNSSEALEKIRIIATYPDGFTLISSVPERAEGNNLWQIERIEAGNEGEIQVKGKFSGEAGEMKEIKAQVGFLDAAGSFNPQVEKTILVLLINPELTLEMKINGQSEDIAVPVGETLTYYLKYKNNSDLEITDLELGANLDPDLLDWDTLEDDLGGEVLSGSIIWKKDELEKLESIKPGDEGEIVFKINVIDSINLQDSDDKNFEIENYFSASSASLSDLGGGGLAVESEKIGVKIISTLTLSCEARYYSEENEMLGSGPLPPEVGETTAYRVFWYLSNTTNEVTEAEIKTTLPEDVYWTGKDKSVSAGTLEFEPVSRTVKWSINRIPVGTGQVYSQLSASFEISVTPGVVDLGLIKILTDKTKATGIDSFTETDLTASCDSLTSDLRYDTYGQGKGIVVSGE